MSGERQGTYGEQMIFIGLKRSSWPAGLVATTGVMLYYDLKMTGDAAALERRGGEGEPEMKRRACRRGEPRRPAARLSSHTAACANTHPYMFVYIYVYVQRVRLFFVLSGTSDCVCWFCSV